MTTTSRPHDTIDIASHAFWARPQTERESVFAELRATRPVSWQRPAETHLLPDPDDPGFWAIVRHADIVAVSRDAATFGSGQDLGGVMMENAPEETLEMAMSIIAMDNPRHATLRKIISSVFTPRRIKLIEDQIAAQARAIVADLGERGECDFVAAVASRLPTWTISEMIGIPEESRVEFTAAANALVSWNDPEFIGEDDPMQVIFDALMTIHRGAYPLIEERAARPQDDLLTALVQAEVDGHRLTAEEIAAFLVLLCVAGNDTTRHTTTHTVLALDRHPDQKAYLIADFNGRVEPAIDEFLRWATPVMTFRRTARRDAVIGGQRIAAGEKVVLIYPSGNRDETVFTDPGRFELGREPNPHLAFGGGGPHYCLGSHLARAQLRMIFAELLRRLPGLEVVGEPEYLAGNFINGIKRLPVRY